MLSLISLEKSKILGLSHIIVASILLILPSISLSNLEACSKKIELSAFSHFLSVGGNKLPISPKLTIPNILSVIA